MWRVEYLPSLLLVSLEFSNTQLKFHCPCGTAEDWGLSIVPKVKVIDEINVHCFIIVIIIYRNNDYYYLQ